MPNQSFYPKDLVVILQQRWRDAGHDPAVLPSDEGLLKLIDVAYQASLLREEDSPVHCRVLISSPSDPEIEAIETEDDGVYVVQFVERCGFSAHQVRKMAAAVGYYRSLIGVRLEAGQNSAGEIWGMIVTGADWVNHTEATVHIASTLPNKLVIHILGPGHLVFASGLTRF